MVDYVRAHLTRDRSFIPLIQPWGVCVHWTGNVDAGANAMNTRNWFENGERSYKVNSQLIIDDRAIVECMPLTEVAYHCGSAYPTKLAMDLFRGRQNYYLIGVEWCVNSDADGGQTYRNVIGTIGWLFATFNWPLDRILRHGDLTTTKLCPAFFQSDYWCGKMGLGSSASLAWDKFRRDVRIAASSAQIQRAILGRVA